MSNKQNCVCDQQKALKGQIRQLKRIITSQKKCIMLLKRKIETDSRLRKCQKTIDRCMTNQGIKYRHTKELSSDEDLLSETSEDPENPNTEAVQSTATRLNLEM
jgi:hypothetical protein